MDTLGDHAVACHGRGDMISRQDRPRDKILSTCSAANLSPNCEQKNLIPETNSRPGDVYLPCWSARQPAALDITITSPLQPSIISNAARKSGFALRAAEHRKLEQYSQQCANIGVQFIPMTFESFGGLSELVRKTLKRITLLIDNRSLYSAGLSVAFRRLAQLVSVTLTRGNAIADSKKRRTVSQLQAKEASLMSHMTFDCAGFSIPIANQIVWVHYPS